MVGFMRKPQMINDPSAAPAEMRADDVDLQAQEGDFIMGYPAMQQSGARVRSLVEQAVMKAKNAGVKTKGYKDGDKVDILVHNGEMHIPQELVPYVDGGYTTLKKLNAPSKYDEGDTVIEERAPYNPDVDFDNLIKTEPAPYNLDSNVDYFPMEEIQNEETKKRNVPIPHPTTGSVMFMGNNPVKGRMAWEGANKKMKNIFLKDKEFDNKSKYANRRLYIEAMGNLKQAIEAGVDSNSQFSGERLNNIEFLKNIARATELAHMLNKLNYINTGQKLHGNPTITPFGIKFHYPNGTPGLAGKDMPFETGYDDREKTLLYEFDDNFNEDSNWIRQDGKKFQVKHNIKDDNVNSSGGTGFSGITHTVKFNNDYNKVFEYLKRDDIEGFRPNIYNDNEHPAIGYGHRLTKAEIEKYKNGITQQEAEDLLLKDIMEAETQVRVVYNKFIKDKKFTGAAAKKFRDLDANRRAILVEMAFNMGASKISPDNPEGFPKFFEALAHNDYETMSKEYHRKGVSEDRNNEFLKLFIHPSLGKFNLKEILNEK